MKKDYWSFFDIERNLVHFTDGFTPPLKVAYSARKWPGQPGYAGTGRTPDGRYFRVNLQSWPQGDGFWAQFHGWA